MEDIVKAMLEEANGVPIKTVKSFLSKIPSVFTGADLVTWITKHVPVTDIGTKQMHAFIASRSI